MAKRNNTLEDEIKLDEKEDSFEFPLPQKLKQKTSSKDGDAFLNFPVQK